MIVYGKVTHDIFHAPDGSFHIVCIRRHGGDQMVGTYYGEEPPTPRKTIEYEFRGEETVHPKYGKQFAIENYQRSDVKGDGPKISRRVKKFEDDVNKHMRDL